MRACVKITSFNAICKRSFLTSDLPGRPEPLQKHVNQLTGVHAKLRSVQSSRETTNRLEVHRLTISCLPTWQDWKPSFWLSGS